jgi:catalase (peroxidase I)
VGKSVRESLVGTGGQVFFCCDLHKIAQQKHQVRDQDLFFACIHLFFPCSLCETKNSQKNSMFGRFRISQRVSRTFKWTSGGVFVGASAVAFAGATVLCKESPPFDEKKLRRDIEKALYQGPVCVNGPLVIRLAWHEAGTWDKHRKDGSPNSASMRFKPECQYGANAGLDKARDLLEQVKKSNPGVSYADIWSLAAVVAVAEMGGPSIPWRWGRVDAKDGSVCPPDGRLPDASKTQDHVREVFNRMGFDDKEIVALLGAHTVGECHADRSGFVGPWTHDKLGFDNSYFTELFENEWIVNPDVPNLQFMDSKTRKLMMVPGDIALLIDPKFKVIAKQFANDNELFCSEFAKAFQKLLELGNNNLHSL